MSPRTGEERVPLITGPGTVMKATVQPCRHSIARPGEVCQRRSSGSADSAAPNL